jgi:hypothetical protein
MVGMPVTNKIRALITKGATIFDHGHVVQPIAFSMIKMIRRKPVIVVVNRLNIHRNTVINVISASRITVVL